MIKMIKIIYVHIKYYHKMEQKLANILIQIEKNETNYDEREVLVYRALILAKKLNYDSGIYNDSLDDSMYYPAFRIYLPDIGEITWSCPLYKGNHSKKDIYYRTNKYIIAVYMNHLKK